MQLCEDIKEIILKQMPDALVFVQDPQNDGTHLEATVISKDFNNMSLVAQHRQVMNLLKNSFSTNLHALKLTTLSYDQWELKKRENI